MKNYNLEVLVSTMNQKDYSLIKKMNIQTDALFINQCDLNQYEELKKYEKNIRIISNTERGLSKSRNQALLNAKGDICLIADDDIKYVDGYEKKVIDAFNKIPEADIIIFNTTMVNYSGSVKRSDIKKIGKAPKYKNYGSVRIAFKRKSFLKYNIWFNILFGAGSLFGAGEETLVLRDANRKGLKIYEYPENIAEVDYSTSTWFEGYNEKYFYNKGAFLAAAYPRLKNVLKFYYIWRLKKYTDLSNKEIIKSLKSGFTGYRKTINYEEYKKINLQDKK